MDLLYCLQKCRPGPDIHFCLVKYLNVHAGFALCIYVHAQYYTLRRFLSGCLIRAASSHDIFMNHSDPFNIFLHYVTFISRTACKHQATVGY